MNNKVKKKEVSKIDVINLLNSNTNIKSEVTITSIENMKGIIDTILEKDQDSVEQVFDILSKELDNSNNKNEFYELCKKVRADYSKALDDSNLSETERKEILNREMQIIEIAFEMEKDKQKNDMEIARIGSEKYSENKKFLWSVLGVAGAVVLTTIGVKFGKNILKQ